MVGGAVVSKEIFWRREVLPFHSLDAVTATGPGDPLDLEGVGNLFTLQLTITAEASGSWFSTYAVEGSLDGENWYPLPYMSPSVLSRPDGGTPGPGGSGSGTATIVTSAPNQVGGDEYAQLWPGHLFRYVRANLTGISGTTSFTADAWVAGVPLGG